MHVLLGVCGGIAACKAPELVRTFRRAGAEVRCLVTPAASSFVAPLALEVLSGTPVWDESYLEPGVDGVEQHVELAEWADVLCVAPATANTISRLAWGLADDLLTTTALMFDGPLVVAPAMHSNMWHHPAVAESVAQLERRGAEIVGPATGPLASGEIGVGRLSDLEEIVAAAVRVGGNRDYAGLRVVVSAGPTWEAVDAVRFVGNRSSGRMGFSLAERAAARGAEVVLVSGPSALPSPHGVVRVPVTSAVEMRDALHEVADEADMVIMAAAVADYRPSEAAAGKIKKEAGGLDAIALVENPDILAGLAEVAPQAIRVGFAAETEDLLVHAQSKLERKQAHLLVANDVSRTDIGFDSTDNEVTIVRPGREPLIVHKADKGEVAEQVLDAALEVLRARRQAEGGGGAG